jgi:hypothetical protein
MSQPNVAITELDGALGALPPDAGLPLVFVGPADSGPLNTPAAFARTKDLLANFGGGPTVEAAAYWIERHRRPAIFVRTGASVLGSYVSEVEEADGEVGELTDEVTGTSVITVDPSSDPAGTYEVQVIFVVGGTRGVTGIIYQYTLDGGDSWSFAQALGTDTTITLGASGIVLAIGAGTLIASDSVSFSTTGPTPASAGELEVEFDGTSVPTLDATTYPNDDYEVVVRFVAGGTRGTPGITYQWSLDGGRTMSPVTALGSAVYIVIPGSGGVKVDLSAGTIVAGDELSFPTVAPQWNDTELQDALVALRQSALAWELASIVGPIDGDAFDVVELAFAGMHAAGKYRAWIGNTRTPVGEESEAAYLASLSAAFGSKESKFGIFCAAAQKLTSGVSGRKYRRPVSFVAGAEVASSSQEVDVADVNRGAITGCSITDANGNPDEHDETNNPGLDDARFTVLRTWDGYPGVYVNNPRVFSSPGSDFEFAQHRRVMNLALSVLRNYFIRRLSKAVVVDKVSGFILEEEALEIESGATKAMAAVLLAKPKASAVSFSLSRTDNLLSTKTMTGDAKVTPLAYPKQINLAVGFHNPALQVQAA